ncbi:MAG TPA: HesA/MoeB/ThiF family protein, partial [Bacteroidia bacterium]|nr:HesA/MoeB/ThiF family protein [Bacteroidia bacterium]
MDTKDKNIRYQRQIILSELGLSGQHKLLSSKVLVIGAGGLGCPALQYLSAAGVGQIGIVDFDVVEVSNLHRQVLYSMSDIGKPKAEAAARKIIAFNPEIQTDAFIVQLTNKNALELIRNYDLVIDCSDNFYTRYLVNDACVILEKP